ncbi:Der GTPase-activating protein YihI [Colwellia sp. KU-HH00111]|uniref:Der GTPase-activating protein YihI n=1 Tax=Colwellia sp. KU-HH00111 TaxID=3127652 RepID=UPI003103CB86
MSRTKKSRKQGSAPTAKPKLSKVELANVEPRVRKRKGKKPGNRQQEAQPVSQQDQKAAQNKDPRIGSKKPIDLGGAAKSPATQSTKPKQTRAVNPASEAIAAVRRVDKDDANVELSLAQQLANIEADERLQTILEKQEDELSLTEDEVHYFNDLMERHQQISAQLDDADEDQTPASIGKSEDDLWDKLDSSSVLDSLTDDDRE